MNVQIFAPANPDPSSRDGSLSSVFAFAPTLIVTATIATGDVPPNTPARATLYLSSDGVNYVTAASAAAGSGTNKTYRFTFKMEDYNNLAAWVYGRLGFTSDNSQPVTCTAWIDGTGSFQTLSTTGLATFASETVTGQSKVTVVDYADDAAAAAGGVPVGGLYQTSGAVKVRVS